MSNAASHSQQGVEPSDRQARPAEAELDHPAQDPRIEGQRLVALAERSGIALRMMGGVAISVRCASAQQEPLARMYRDIDFAARSADGRQLTALLAGAGYEAVAEFNALHGRHRMFFWDPANRREADVFLDRFAMCHSLDFRARLDLHPHTLSLADLLLFKLQVMETNEKDYKDILALLADHPPGPDGFDVAHIARFLSSDWGWWRTVTLVLDRVEVYARDLPRLRQRERIAENIHALRETIGAEPKSGRWKMRAKIGERKRWYETPEDAHEPSESEGLTLPS